MVLSCALSSPLICKAVVQIDDFEGYTPGDVDSTANPPWTAEVSGMADIVADAADPNNDNYLVFSGPNDWRHLYRPTGTSIDSTGKFLFRIFVESESVDHSIGLADSSEALDWFSDYSAQVRVIDSDGSGNGTVGLSVRDGGGFVDGVATLNLNQWYDIEFDINTSGGDSGNGGFDLYVDNVLEFSNADFRRPYGDPLDNVLLFGSNGQGKTLRIDDLRLDSVVGPGDVDGDGDVDLDDYNDILTHFQQSTSLRSEGDLNGDGIVNLDDFAEWRLAYVPPGSQAITVPEPSSITLVLGLAVACVAPRYRMRCH